MHKTIVMAVMKLGTTTVKPSALFAKVFEATPKKTAKAKNKYDVKAFTLFN